MSAGKITVRRAAPQDGKTIADVFLSARAEALPLVKSPHSEAETRSYLASLVTNPKYALWVTEQKDELLGFLALRDEWVDHLYIRPDWYRRGIGTRLLDIAKRHRPDGLRLFCFQCNLRARAFYDAKGLVIIRSSDGSENEEREPDLEYAWREPPASG